MKSFKIIFLNILLIATVFSCSTNNDTEPDNTDVLDASKAYQELDISYGADANQKFDLYLPANRTTNTKIMVLVHGGGWSSGDKSSMDPVKALLQQDFPNLAIVNINYRLADANNQPYPMQINDITSIINYLKDNKTKYTISNTLGFIGTSAGAHLSLLWSYAFDASSNVNMVCSIVGPTNFTDPAYLNNTNTELQGLLDLYGVNPALPFLEEISPYHQATAASPPTILFYGGMDELIPATQGTDMRDKLESLNVTHEFTLYPNASHGGIAFEIFDIWAKLKVFINSNL